MRNIKKYINKNQKWCAAMKDLKLLKILLCFIAIINIISFYICIICLINNTSLTVTGYKYIAVLMAVIVLMLIFVAIYFVKYVKRNSKEKLSADQSLNKIKNDYKAIKSNEGKYRLIFDSLSCGLWNWNVTSGKVSFSNKWCHIFGYKENTLINIDSYYNLIYPDDRNYVKGKLKLYFKNKENHFECKYRFKFKDGIYRWTMLKGKALFDNNGKAYIMSGLSVEMDDMNKYQKEMYEYSYYDSLTGIPNKFNLYNTLNRELNKKCSNATKIGAVFDIDIDNFKLINDTLGNAFCDEFIVNFIDRLMKLQDDHHILYKTGGDEYAFLLRDINDKKNVEDFAEKLMNIFQVPFNFKDNIIHITVSIGVSIYPTDASNADQLVRYAGIAMNKVKLNGKNGYMFFNETIKKELIDTVNVENGLRKAIEDDELCLYYQPLIDASTEKIKGFEALIRWKSHKYGMVPPNKFIKIAEESGLIIPIGKIVLEKACKFIKELNKNMNTNYYVSVNVSVIQLMEKDFLNNVFSVLVNNNLSPRFLQIEITESVFADIRSPKVTILKKLANAGITISIDDFGTGYSSLSYLQKLPVGEIKVDKSFVDDILVNNEENKSIADSIIDIGHKLGLKVVAEGVENEKQLIHLKKSNCDIIQGYYFYKPMPSDEVDKLFQK